MNSCQTAEEWLTGLRRNPNPTTFREPLTNLHVTIDGDQLAFVRTDFRSCATAGRFRTGSISSPSFANCLAGRSRLLRTCLYLPSNSIIVRAALAAFWIRPLCRRRCVAGVGGGDWHDSRRRRRHGGRRGIRDVSVRLQSSGHAVVTDDDGRFEFQDVPAGDQQLYVSAVDFILVKRAVSVAANGTADITIALTEGTGAYTESVDVRARLPMTRREPAVAAERDARRAASCCNCAAR